MSYEVYFTMTTDKGEEETITAFSGLGELDCIFELDETPGEFMQGRFGRDSEVEFKEYSKEHPGVLFSVECESSEGSYWIDYYRDGKHQCSPGEIVYPPFDETKLV